MNGRKQVLKGEGATTTQDGRCSRLLVQALPVALEGTAEYGEGANLVGDDSEGPLTKAVVVGGVKVVANRDSQVCNCVQWQILSRVAAIKSNGTGKHS